MSLFLVGSTRQYISMRREERERGGGHKSHTHTKWPEEDDHKFCVSFELKKAISGGNCPKMTEMSKIDETGALRVRSCCWSTCGGGK